MIPYDVVMAASPLPTVMRRTQRWLLNFICQRHKDQHVVGHRKDSAGIPVRQDEFDQNFPAAHVCPFVQESIGLKHFWLEESLVLPSDPDEVKKALLAQIPLFKNTNPVYDPVPLKKAAVYPVYLKTFLTVLPAFVQVKPAQFRTIMDKIHADLRSQFIAEGLMLGQFYQGCDEPCVHNTAWGRPGIGPLIAPYPSFAVRYMAQHDHLFIKPHDPGNPNWQIYLQYFPQTP